MLDTAIVLDRINYYIKRNNIFIDRKVLYDCLGRLGMVEHKVILSPLLHNNFIYHISEKYRLIK